MGWEGVDGIPLAWDRDKCQAARFQVLTDGLLKIPLFWDVTLSSGVQFLIF
jgi:hypothetical protein